MDSNTELSKEPMKKCTKCKKDKPHSAYHRHKRYEDGLQVNCIECRKEIKRKSQAKTKYVTKTPHKPKKGFSFGESYPELVPYYCKDNQLSAFEVSRSSGFEAQWQCPECRERFKSSIKRMVGHKNRSVSNLCPRKFEKHKSVDLPKRSRSVPFAEVNPWAKEWFSDKNNVSADYVLFNSTERFIWSCPKCGKEKKTTPRKIVNHCVACETRARSIALLAPHLLDEWNDQRDPYTVTIKSAYRANWKCRLNDDHKWNAHVYSRTSSTSPSSCPHCSNQSSKAENEILEYIESMGVSCISRDRKAIGKELDIYIPDMKVAIEYNGVYWHDEDHVGQDSHMKKWLLCQAKGIRLFTIWEDDWAAREDSVKAMIKNELLHVPLDENNIVRSVDFKVARKFIESNHVQKVDSTHLNFAIADDSGHICSMIALEEKSPNRLIVKNFVSKSEPSTSLLMFLHHVKKNFGVCYRTLEVEFNNDSMNSSFLTSLGFSKVRTTNPDYSYVVRSARVHRDKYREMVKFDLGFIYRDDLTDQELSVLNSHPRIFDCGTSVYSIEMKDIR